MTAKFGHIKVPKLILSVLCGLLLTSLAFCLLMSKKLNDFQKNSIDLTKISVSLTNKPINTPGMERLLAKEEGEVISIVDNANNNLIVIYYYPNSNIVGNSKILWNTVMGEEHSAAGVVSKRNIVIEELLSIENQPDASSDGAK